MGIAPLLDVGPCNHMDYRAGALWECEPGKAERQLMFGLNFEARSLAEFVYVNGWGDSDYDLIFF